MSISKCNDHKIWIELFAENRTLLKNGKVMFLSGIYIMQNTMVGRVAGGEWPLGEKIKSLELGGKNLKGETEKEENYIKKLGKRP